MSVEKKKCLTVVVGSKTALKIEAVQSVMSKYRVVGVDVKSLVSDQPIGPLETLTGAFNRANAARLDSVKSQETIAFWIGIENGIMKDMELKELRGKVNFNDVSIQSIEHFLENIKSQPTQSKDQKHQEFHSTTTLSTSSLDVWVDCGCIVIMTEKKVWIGWSRTVLLPSDWVQQALAHRPQTYTSLLNDPRVDKKDPHSFLTNGQASRQTILAHALAELIATLPSTTHLAPV